MRARSFSRLLVSVTFSIIAAGEIGAEPPRHPTTAGAGGLPSTFLGRLSSTGMRSLEFESLVPLSRALTFQGQGDLPLTFEVNQGQFTPEVGFFSRGNGYEIGLLHHGNATLRLHRGTRLGSTDALLALEWVGASPQARIEGVDPLYSATHYLVGRGPLDWHVHVPQYARVLVQDLYPGVSLFFYGNQRGLEYDLEVAPGKDISAIHFRLRGAQRLRLSRSGDLILAVQGGEAVLRRPTFYQEIDGLRQKVAGQYVLRSGKEIGFSARSYDHTRPLLIDPVLSFSTYLGGSGTDVANAIAVAPDSSIYVAGLTRAADFPATLGQAPPPGQDRAFVVKLSADGKNLLWAAYLGGSVGEEARALALDPQGNMYVTGQTRSPDFPVRNPFQPSCSLDNTRSCNDAFVVKLDPNGHLLYSTFLGGSGAEAGNAIAIDSAGNIFVAGETTSTDFPAFKPLQATTGGGRDAFLAKISPDGQSLAYATYLGGRGDDTARSITVDSAGSVFLTGQTYSVDFPTQNAFQVSCNAVANAQCAGTVFIAKVAADGQSLAYSTYLGGSAQDAGNGIAVDGAGNAYITGSTKSADFPLQNPMLHSLQGSEHVFVAKLSASGSQLLYSTYVGGSLQEEGEAIAVDAARRAHIAGWTRSTDFPVRNAVQNTCKLNALGQCGSAAFVTTLDANGAQMLFSTYLGSGGSDQARAIAVDATGSIYVAGSSGGSNVSTTTVPQNTGSVSNAVQTSSTATGGAFVAKLAIAAPLASTTCGGQTISWTGSAGDNQWTTASNWDLARLPISTDVVCISNTFVGVTITIGTISSSTNQTISILTDNADISVTGGPLTISGASVFANNLTVSGGTLVLNSTSTVGGAMTHSAGTVAGTGTLTVTGLFTWSGGFQCTEFSGGVCVTGSPNATTTANGGISFPASAGPQLNGRTLNNTGTANWTGATGSMFMSNGAQVNNGPTSAAIWNYQNDSSIFSGGGTGQAFNNSGGLFEKTAGTGTSTVNDPVAFNNTGSVLVGTGTLSFAGGGSCGGTCGGTWSVASGATLGFAFETFALSGSFSGAGTVAFSGGTANLTGTYNITGGTTASGGTANFNAGAKVTSTGALTISFGGLNFSSGSAVSSTTLTQSGGTLTGSDTVSLSGLVTWSAGTQSGTGATNANGGMSFPGGSAILDTRTLNVSGATTFGSTTAGASSLSLQNGAVVNNLAGATWSLVAGNGQGISFSGGAAPTFNNAGTFQQVTGATNNTVSVAFNNNTGGTVAVNAGTLSFSGGGTCSGACAGSWSAGAGAALGFGGGTFALSGSFSGAGTVAFSGGTENLTGTYNITGGTTASGGTANFNAGAKVTSTGALTISSGGLNFSSGSAVSSTTLTQSGGTLTGSDTVSLSGLVTWSAGTQSGTGATNANGGMSFPGGSAILDTRTLNVSGATTFGSTTAGASSLSLQNGAVVNNLAGATWSLVAGNGQGISFSGGAAPTFNNAGTFQQVTGATNNTVSVAFNNNTGGTVAVNAGTLSFSGGGTCSGACAGSWSAGAGAALGFGGGTFALSGSFSGAGTVAFGGGTEDLTGTYNITGGTTASGGTANFNAGAKVTSTGALTISSGGLNFSSGSAVSSSTLTQSGGTLTGSDTVSLSGLVTWSVGTQSGTGTTNANGGTSFPGGSAILDTRTLNVSGATTFGSTTVASNLSLQNGAVVNNLAGATWSLVA